MWYWTTFIVYQRMWYGWHYWCRWNNVIPAYITKLKDSFSIGYYRWWRRGRGQLDMTVSDIKYKNSNSLFNNFLSFIRFSGSIGFHLITFSIFLCSSLFRFVSFSLIVFSRWIGWYNNTMSSSGYKNIIIGQSSKYGWCAVFDGML